VPLGGVHDIVAVVNVVLEADIFVGAAGGIVIELDVPAELGPKLFLANTEKVYETPPFRFINVIVVSVGPAV